MTKLRMLALAGAAAMLLAGAACRSEQPRGGGAASRPAASADPLSVDQPEQMAAEDAARFNPPPPQGEPEPSRRPREPQTRRPVDQPRIRP